MGPRRDGRGVKNAEALKQKATGLQWGRGAMAAEWRPRTASDATYRSRLQWGRGAMAAECRSGSLRRLSAQLELQWGRGAMAAECHTAGTITTGLIALQWGRGAMAAECTLIPNG